MSPNDSLYAAKMREIRDARRLNGPLRSQFEELLQFVRECEATWRQDDRRGPKQRAIGER